MSANIRKIVCGSRYTKDPAVVEHVLREEFSNGEHMVVGYDPNDERHQGIDQLAYEWAGRNKVPGTCYPAPWNVMGNRAGPHRNGKMARSGATKCIAFPGGKGTRNMVKQAEKVGVPVRIIEP